MAPGLRQTNHAAAKAECMASPVARAGSGEKVMVNTISPGYIGMKW
jgi:hypothetical protein